MDIAIETVEQAWPGVARLMADNREEAKAITDAPLNPHLEGYLNRETVGALLVLTVRDSEQNMHGYAMFCIDWHPHYAETLVAYCDMIYLRPEARKGNTGVRLIRRAEQELRDRFKVDSVAIAAPPGGSLARLLEAVRYEMLEVVYFRRTVWQ